MSITNDLSPAELARRLDALCDRFEEGWQAGRPPTIEELLTEAPEPARRRFFADLLALERDYRGRAGRPIDETEARDRFAQLGSWAVEAKSCLCASKEVVGAGGRFFISQV